MLVSFRQHFLLSKDKIMRYKSLSIIIGLFLFTSSLAQVYNDATLAQVREKDQAERIANGKIPLLSAAEHLYRADVYNSNRAFPQAREHWQMVIQNYPADAGMPKALFGMGRSLMWERQYADAVTWFDRAVKDFLDTKDGREALAFKGACLIRLGKNEEAAKVYEQYTIMFPTGERIDSAYLNIVDALREAQKYDDANLWVDKARQRFSGLPAETNALFARLRMEMFRQRWDKAMAASDELVLLNDFGGSMTSRDEAVFLKAYALERSGRKNEAINFYFAVSDSPNSYYGGLATERLMNLTASDAARKSQVLAREAEVKASSSKLVGQFPAPYNSELLMYSKSRGIDPRFVLSIMKQESSFRANAKSPAAARGLLQLTVDAAQKYTRQAGISNLQAESLYQPGININLGSIYIAELKKQFNLYEAIAASYNGGEDNVARWLNRARPKEAPIFASEVGFAETKNYVFKVMSNYRVYRELYTEDLRRK
jgi:soluble lytic murein transglycosylase